MAELLVWHESTRISHAEAVEKAKAPKALEPHPSIGAFQSGSGVATLRVDADFQLRVVDGLVSGLHVPGESHFDLLRAFASRERLTRAIELAAHHGLSSHELGDACLIV